MNHLGVPWHMRAWECAVNLTYLFLKRPDLQNPGGPLRPKRSKADVKAKDAAKQADHFVAVGLARDQSNDIQACNLYVVHLAA